MPHPRASVSLLLKIWPKVVDTDPTWRLTNPNISGRSGVTVALEHSSHRGWGMFPTHAAQSGTITFSDRHRENSDTEAACCYLWVRRTFIPDCTQSTPQRIRFVS